MEQLQRQMARNGWVRPDHGGWFGGVCAGVANRLHTDIWATRILVALLVATVHLALLVYVAAWFMMPDQDRATRLLTGHTGSTPSPGPAAPVSNPAQAQYPL